jgi:hypothetical protein
MDRREGDATERTDGEAEKSCSKFGKRRLVAGRFIPLDSFPLDVLSRLTFCLTDVLSDGR